LPAALLESFYHFLEEIFGNPVLRYADRYCPIIFIVSRKCCAYTKNAIFVFTIIKCVPECPDSGDFLEEFDVMVLAVLFDKGVSLRYFSISSSECSAIMALPMAEQYKGTCFPSWEYRHIGFLLSIFET
jgi:hypothetical protein